MALEKRIELTPAQDQQVRALTQSDALDTRLNGMWDILEQTEGAYLAKLAAMAPHDLSAYHEFINPHEPPAEHHYFMCDHLMRVANGEISTLILSFPPGAAKALALDTAILTTEGWTTMAQLSIGDKVYSDLGEECTVTYKSPVWKARSVYAVTTACGEIIIADEDHEWEINTEDRRNNYVIMKTKDIFRIASEEAARPGVRRALPIKGPLFETTMSRPECKEAVCESAYSEITLKEHGFADTVCISVDSPSRLFLCGKSLTITHNSTYASRSFASWLLGVKPDWRILAVSHSQKFGEDEFSKPNRSTVDGESFHGVFPDVSLNPLEKGASFWRLQGWRGSYAVRGALAGTA
jgi:hypothetical protein